MEKYCKNQIKYNLQQKEIIKRKKRELYVKWKDYDKTFYNWTDKKIKL